MKKDSLKIKQNKCNHYPIIGRNANVKYGGCWRTIEITMDHIIRQCVKCGKIEVGYFTKYNPEMFLSREFKRRLDKEREIHAVDMIQPIDFKTGKFNEDFGKYYGYNPMKTVAPKLQQKQDNVIDDLISEKLEKNIKLQKLKKQK